jgi:hypothetical protein
VLEGVSCESNDQHAANAVIAGQCYRTMMRALINFYEWKKIGKEKQPYLFKGREHVGLQALIENRSARIVPRTCTHFTNRARFRQKAP